MEIEFEPREDHEVWEKLCCLKGFSAMSKGGFIVRKGIKDLELRK